MQEKVEMLPMELITEITSEDGERSHCLLSCDVLSFCYENIDASKMYLRRRANAFFTSCFYKNKKLCFKDGGR